MAIVLWRHENVNLVRNLTSNKMTKKRRLSTVLKERGRRKLKSVCVGIYKKGICFQEIDLDSCIVESVSEKILLPSNVQNI
jgi:hypothetical protein